MKTSFSDSARPLDVLKLAWPIMVSMASYSAMSLVDAIYVSHLGTSELAAVGLASSGLHLCTALWFGTISAVRILVAQGAGAERPEDARQFAWHGLYFAVVTGLFTWSLLPFSATLLWLLGGTASMVEHGTGYLSVRLCGSIVVFVVLALQGWFQGRGDTRTPMMAILAGNAVNIVLDPLLIHGRLGFPALGVTGAAVATVFAWVVQVVWLGWAARESLGSRVRFSKTRFRELISIGLPIGTHYVLDVAAFALFALMLASVGEAHVAAHVVVVRILMASFLPGYALGEATGVLVGRALGAKRPEVAREAWASGSLLASGIMASFGVLFLASPALLVTPFGAEPEVLELAVQVLMLAGLVQVFDALAMVGLGALNGAGDTRYSMMLGLTLAWTVKVPVSAVGVFVLDLGVVGAWLGVAAELVLLSFLAVRRIRGKAWLQHSVSMSASTT